MKIPTDISVTTASPTEAAKIVWAWYRNRWEADGSPVDDGLPADHLLSMMRSESFGHVRERAVWNADRFGEKAGELVRAAIETLEAWREAPVTAAATAPPR